MHDIVQASSPRSHAIMNGGIEDSRARAAVIHLFIIWYIRYIWFSTGHIVEVQGDLTWV